MLEILSKYSFWENLPQRLGLRRDYYLKLLQSFLKTDAMIVITGARRTGKSVLIQQLIEDLHKKGTKAKDILYFNFFLRPLKKFTTEDEFWKALKTWQEKRASKGNRHYLILDEVQELENWDEVVASIIEDHTLNIKIILTGSNSKLISSDATTKLSGRFYSLTVFPFSFYEYCQLKQCSVDSIESFKSFLHTASSPEACLAEDPVATENLIEGIVNTAIQKDIIERYNPSSPAVLAKLVEYTRLNSSNEFSLKNINNSINNQLKKVDHVGLTKVEEYFYYLQNVYFCYECPKYSYRKKDLLARSSNKYYLNDWGMALYSNNFEPGRILENVIFLELLKKGYSVSTYYAYNNANLEIDFQAKKGSRTLFIQVSWLLGDIKENAPLYEREVGNLKAVKENGEKLIITMDDEIYIDQGVEHLSPPQFIAYL